MGDRIPRRCNVCESTEELGLCIVCAHYYCPKHMRTHKVGGFWGPIPVEVAA